MTLIEYQVSMFITSSGPLFVALGVILVSSVLVFGIGRTRSKAIKDMKDRAGQGYTFHEQGEDKNDP